MSAAFKINPTYSKIIKSLLEYDVLKETTHFKCFNEHLFIYQLNQENRMFSFEFLCEDSLVYEMTIEQLLLLDKIEYFEYCLYEKIGDDWMVIEHEIYDTFSDEMLN